MPSFALYLLLGAVAGTLAGLFGLGGGAIIVPVLVFSFQALGVSDSVLMHLALGTSLASIVVTAANSVRTHHQLGNVAWPIVWRMVAGIVIGTATGSVVAGGLDGTILRRTFTVFLLLVVIKMASGWTPQASREGGPPGTPVLVGAGGAIGFASALFGIGGGTMSVPFFAWSGLEMKRAVGSSAACGLPIAISGGVTYAVVGWGQAELPAFSVGYVYLPALLGIVLTSAPFARLGAKLADRLPEQWLRRAFAALVLLIAVKMAWGG
jgi:uncharacterized membrane protein YfcA